MLDLIAIPSIFPAFIMPGGTEWIVLLVLGLLIFGRRLPEVGRSLGRGIVEFKRGVKGIEDEVEDASSEPKKLPAESSHPRIAETPGGAGEHATESRAASEGEASYRHGGEHPGSA
jgi:sec-independent protein translocase protein TatA